MRVAPTFLLAAGLLFSSSAMGQYLSTKSAWDNMNPNAQISYAAGLYDGLFVIYSGDSPSNVAQVQGASRCFQDLALAASDLVDLIDLQYQDASNWRLPPVVVAIIGVQEVCREFINSARAEQGLGPLVDQ